MATFGNASGAVPPVSPLALMPKSLFLTRPTLFSHIATTAERLERWRELTGWIEDGLLDVRVGHRFPRNAAADAHRALESRSTTGKVVLTNGHPRPVSGRGTHGGLMGHDDVVTTPLIAGWPLASSRNSRRQACGGRAQKKS